MCHIRRVRRKVGYSSEGLSQLCPLASRSICKIFRGKKIPGTRGYKHLLVNVYGFARQNQPK